MSSVEVKLNSSGISEVLKSSGIAADLQVRAAKICAAANAKCSADSTGKDSFATSCAVVGDRYQAAVKVNSAHGRNAARKGYLQAALKSGA